MDEPLSNLDAKLRAQTRAELIRLHQELRTTTVYVTHDQTEAMTMGTRIVVMKDGLIQQVDTPKSIYSHPRNAFVAGFIGSPAMNFIEGTITLENERYYFHNKRLRLGIPEKFVPALKSAKPGRMLLGIRPEHVACEPEIVRRMPDPISAAIDIVEHMGSDTFLYLKLGEQTVIARIGENDTQFEPGGKLNMAFRMEKSHFFNAETGDNISMM